MTPRGFRIFALLATVAGAYHGLAAAGVIPAGDASVTRHLVFVGVNVLLACYFVRRPLWGLPPFLLLVAQQTHGHGKRIIEWWERGAFDMVSAAVLLVLFAAVMALALDACDRSPRIRR